MKKAIRIICAILAILMLSTFPAMALDLSKPSKEFSDVNTGAWYYKNMDTLIRAGGIDGFPDGTFKPDAGLKLSEFIKIVVSIMYTTGLDLWADYKIDGEVRWYSQYVGAAKHDGLLDNVDFSYAALEAPVNRYNMAVIMVNAAKAMYSPLRDDDVVPYIIYDYESIPDTYKPYVRKTYYGGILTGKDSRGSFSGNDGLTRAEACTAIVRLFDYGERIRYYFHYVDFGTHTVAVKMPLEWEEKCESYYTIYEDFYRFDFYSVAASEESNNVNGWLFSVFLYDEKSEEHYVERYLGYESGMYAYIYREDLQDYRHYDPNNVAAAQEYESMSRDLDNGLITVIVKGK